VFGAYKDISDVPDMVVTRLKHYFLTYKDIPGKESKVQITEVYGIDEAHEIIRRSVEDYHHKFDNLDTFLSEV
ncbi:MAG TPA: inorganic diphosphatase, partial [Bacteroidales bacterium]|nr:inorganic diphosphatase [Bacteroidales bacterium]